MNPLMLEKLKAYGKQIPKLLDIIPFSFEEAVNEFMERRGEQKVLLLSGDAFSGKSTYCHLLYHRLWQYHAEKEFVIPLYVSLSTITNSGTQLIEESLTQQGLTAQEISEFKQQARFFLMIDGYEELGQFQNLYASNQLECLDCQVIITCRRLFLAQQEDYQDYFTPYVQEHPQWHLLTEITSTALSAESIDNYLLSCTAQSSNLEKKNPRVLDTFPFFQLFAQSSFFLRIIGKELPTWDKKLRETQNYQQIQQECYQVLLQQWFEAHAVKCKVFKLGEAGNSLALLFLEYAKALARQMILQGLTNIKYEKPSALSEEVSPWQQFFNVDNEPIRLAFQACPWQVLGKDHYTFIEDGLQDYLASLPLDISLSQQIFHLATNETNKLPSIDEEKLIEHAKQRAVNEIEQHSLNQTLYTQDAIKIGLWADSIRRNDTQSELLKEKLFAFIENSKNNPLLSIAAANAATILSYAKIAFSGRDLSYINIPYANLENSIFDSVNLSHGNLENVSFRNSFMHEVNFDKASLYDVEFFELPYLEGYKLLCFCHKRNILATVNEKMINVYVYYLNNDSHREEYFIGIQITSLHFCTNGIFLFIGTKHGTIFVLDIENKFLWNKSVSKKEITRIQYDSKNCWLYISTKNELLLYKFLDNRDLELKNEFNVEIRTFCLSNDAKWLLYSSYSNIVLLEVNETFVKEIPEAHSGLITCLKFDSSNKVFASGATDLKIIIWDTLGQEKLFVFSGHTDWIIDIDFHLSAKFLASVSFDKTIRLWDMETKKEINIFEGHEARIYNVKFVNDGKVLVSASVDNTLRFWVTDKSSNGFFHSNNKEGHRGWITQVVIHPNALYIITAGHDKFICIWDIITGNCLQQIKFHSSNINAIAINEKGNFLISGGKDGEFFISETQEGGVFFIKKYTRHRLNEFISDSNFYDLSINSMDFISEDRVAIGCNNNSIYIFDCQSKNLFSSTFYKSTETIIVKYGNKSSVNKLKFNSKLNLLFSAHNDGSMKVWKIINKCIQLVLTINAHSSSISCLNFHSDGYYYASSSIDGEIKLWKVSDDRKSIILVGVKKDEWSSCINCISYLEEKILIGKNDGSINIHDLKGNFIESLKGDLKKIFSMDSKEKFKRGRKFEFIACGGFDHSVKVFSFDFSKNKFYLSWIGGARKLFFESCVISASKLSENNNKLLFMKNNYRLKINKNFLIKNDVYSIDPALSYMQSTEQVESFRMGCD